MPMIRERMANHFIALATGFAVVLLVAGLTHFTAVLLLPDVASKDAFTLLTPRGATNHMTLLSPSRPSDRLVPFRDPETVQGICYFDLGQSPVRIRTTTDEGHLLTLSFRTPEGRIFYSMTDRAALRNSIDIRLVTDAQLAAVEDNDDDDAGLPSELRLKAPTRRGLIVATALVARQSDAQDAENRIKAIGCAPEPLPQPQG
jgi:uncharacterized membrane protein